MGHSMGPRSDDELIAYLLIRTWMLNTGRVLRSDVPPHDLTEQELVDFWADGLMTAGPAPDPVLRRDR
jgi:hypothetical protein